jgi:hypothetical protein
MKMAGAFSSTGGDLSALRGGGVTPIIQIVVSRENAKDTLISRRFKFDAAS